MLLLQAVWCGSVCAGYTLGTKLPCLTHVKVFVHSCPNACCKYVECVKHSCPNVCCKYVERMKHSCLKVEYAAVAAEAEGSCVRHAFLLRERRCAPLRPATRSVPSHPVTLIFFEEIKIVKAGEYFPPDWLRVPSCPALQG